MALYQLTLLLPRPRLSDLLHLGRGANEGALILSWLNRPSEGRALRATTHARFDTPRLIMRFGWPADEPYFELLAMLKHVLALNAQPWPSCRQYSFKTELAAEHATVVASCVEHLTTVAQLKYDRDMPRERQFLLGCYGYPSSDRS